MVREEASSNEKEHDVHECKFRVYEKIRRDRLNTSFKDVQDALIESIKSELNVIRPISKRKHLMTTLFPFISGSDEEESKKAPPWTKIQILLRTIDFLQFHVKRSKLNFSRIRKLKMLNASLKERVRIQLEVDESKKVAKTLETCDNDHQKQTNSTKMGLEGQNQATSNLSVISQPTSNSKFSFITLPVHAPNASAPSRVVTSKETPPVLKLPIKQITFAKPRIKHTRKRKCKNKEMTPKLFETCRDTSSLHKPQEQLTTTLHGKDVELKTGNFIKSTNNATTTSYSIASLCHEDSNEEAIVLDDDHTTNDGDSKNDETLISVDLPKFVNVKSSSSITSNNSSSLLPCCPLDKLFEKSSRFSEHKRVDVGGNRHRRNVLQQNNVIYLSNTDSGDLHGDTFSQQATTDILFDEDDDGEQTDTDLIDDSLTDIQDITLVEENDESKMRRTNDKGNTSSSRQIDFSAYFWNTTADVSTAPGVAQGSGMGPPPPTMQQHPTSSSICSHDVQSMVSAVVVSSKEGGERERGKSVVRDKLALNHQSVEDNSNKLYGLSSHHHVVESGPLLTTDMGGGSILDPLALNNSSSYFVTQNALASSTYYPYELQQQQSYITNTTNQYYDQQYHVQPIKYPTSNFESYSQASSSTAYSAVVNDNSNVTHSSSTVDFRPSSSKHHLVSLPFISPVESTAAPNQNQQQPSIFSDFNLSSILPEMQVNDARLKSVGGGSTIHLDHHNHSVSDICPTIIPTVVPPSFCASNNFQFNAATNTNLNLF